MANSSDPVALAQTGEYNPWNLPDTYTVFMAAPEDIRQWLHPHWQTQKALHPMGYYLAGLYFLVIGVVSTIGNGMVLRIFSTCPSLRTPSNMLVMNLAVADFLLMLFLVPELCFNYLTGGPWRFGEFGCTLHGFTGACCGYSAITTLTMISIDRYNVIVKGLSAPPFTFSKAIGFIIFNWIWATGWSICPLFGWGHYTLDGMLGTCSFDPFTNDMSNKSHILATTIAMYLAPLAIIIGCYFFIVQAVFHHEDELRQQAKKMNVTSLRSNADQKQTSAEIRIAKISIMTVGLWVTAWTPFVIICVGGSWGSDPSWITAFVQQMPVFLAKSVCCVNPIVYALSHPKYREVMKELYPWVCIVLETKPKKKFEEDNQSVGTTQESS